MRLQLSALPLALALLAAGCGGGGSQPTLARQDAAELIGLTDQIAAEGPCAQARDIPDVSARAIRLVDQGRVPDALRAPLLAGVNALTARTPACVPPAATATTPVVDAKKAPHGPGPHGHGHKHGKHERDG